MNLSTNRRFVVRSALRILVASLLAQIIAFASTSERPINVFDSVRTRKPIPGEIAISPDGQKIAFVVDAPDLENNRNSQLLYVKDLNAPQSTGNGTLLVTSEQVSNVRWLSDGNTILMQSRPDGTSKIVMVNASTRARSTLWSSKQKIMSMSASADGNTVAYSVNVPSLDAEAKKERETRGFAVKFGEPAADWSREDWWLDQKIYLVKRRSNGSLVRSQICAAEFSIGVDPCVIRGANALSLSPNGVYLTFNHQRATLPETWAATVFGRWARLNGVPVDALGLYDARSKRATVGFDAPNAGFRAAAVWADDSRSFVIASMSPVGSEWEKRDVKNGFTEGRQLESYAHVFAVAVEGSVSEVLKEPAVWFQSGTLAWKHSSGEMLIRKDKQTFAWMRPNGNEWVEHNQFTPSFQGFSLRPSATSSGSPVVSNGAIVVGISETTTSPPEIYLYYVQKTEARALTDLNPQFHDVTLGVVEKIEWKNDYGANCGGYLIRPVGYIPGTRYPLVIMTKGWSDEFFSDTKFRTAFPPQSLANAGFVVLMANMPAADKEPRNYPGRMGEAFNWISMVESGITMLDGRGLVDKHRVGIIGFSRTSWNVDFMITHSAFRFAAASSADSGLYNYGTYWLGNDKRSFQDSEQQLGDAPYGEGFTTWLRYAPAFNAQHVNTPLLMEYCGYRVLPEPIGAEEFFVALNHYRKPVELYFYPLGEHMLDTPRERAASLQRNVDWFRFWIQQYERPNPEDSGQYPRWRALRALHEAERELPEGRDAK
jgi:dipeptidyl aminopeptidase/acylaminoacyl peptidase